MLDSSNLRKGLKLEIDGEPYIVVQFEFVKPGKGQALYKCRLKNMITGSQFDRTYRSGENFNEANLEETEMEYLYFDGEHYCFMNTSNYEQELLSESQVGEAKNFLKENTVCNVLMFDRKPIEFNGISPDVVVHPVSEDLLEGRNTCIRRAEAWLGERTERD